jgi:molybdopterin molybdotransferase
MISISEARERVLAAVRPLPAEAVALAAALDRVLAEDVTSAIDLPPFDNSAMDGFAVVAGDEPELEVIGESRAGHPSAAAVRAGTAIRISTGAMLPAGATAVVPVERTEALDGGGRVRVEPVADGANIRRAGEDVHASETVLRRGAALGPAELGVAAAVGCAGLACARQPRVALLVTGDELTDPGRPLGPGGIYSSNGYALAAQVERAGAALASSERVPDSAGGTRAAIAAALDARPELVIVSGGVSVGPHDHVKGALAELGVEERFWGVSLRPGKPTWFGVREPTLVLGLPGNPVSAMVTFHLFARPALAALQGADPSPRRASAVAAGPITRNAKREQAVRVRLDSAADGPPRASLTGEQGSHMLTSLVGADGLALIPAGEGALETGERLEVELL